MSKGLVAVASSSTIYVVCFKDFCMKATFMYDVIWNLKFTVLLGIYVITCSFYMWQFGVFLFIFSVPQNMHTKFLNNKWPIEMTRT